jgi:archaemetzincin
MKYVLIFFVIGCSLVACTENTPKKIALQPFGNFDASLQDSVLSSIERTYGFEVVALPSRELPKSAFIHVKSPRYRADSIIRILKREKPNEYDYIIGLTSSDISTTKKDKNGNPLEPKSRYQDWGIFGLGFRPGPSCIASTYRLKTNDSGLLIERLKKVCNHELGHNLGLPHCESSDKCVMKDAAESIKTVDNVYLTLCADCSSKIK